ncbi:hypothetical protein BVY01_05135 [bacterium I07]|nr:hypothetical protein BVY01_05135 [bacterium I07]
MYIKQMNFETESLIMTYAEPFAVFRWLEGGEYPYRLLETAWRFLLDNQGHDSIGGCSVDRVHEDMMFRYHQAMDIAKGVMEMNAAYFAARIDLSKAADDEIHLLVVNPTNYDRDEVMTAYVDIPLEWSGGFSIDPQPLTLSIEDEQGSRAEVQQLSHQTLYPVLQQPIDSPLYLNMSRHKICFKGGRVPAFGYTVYRLSAREGARRSTATMVTDLHTMENQYLKISINSNGTWNVEDKHNNITYRDQGLIWDGGETGDPWVHIPPGNNKILTSHASSARIALEIDGPLLARYSITIDLSVPAHASSDGLGRAEQMKILQIKHQLTLRKGAPRLDIMTQVNNVCEDHWLRLLFPTDLSVNDVHVEGQFDIVQRSIQHEAGTESWPEGPQNANPMNSFVDYHNSEKGVAFINYGLKEYEAMDDSRRTFAMTLIRAYPLKITGVGMQDYSKEQKGSQCLGEQVFNYSIYPHSGSWETDVFKQTTLHNQAMNILQVARNNGNGPKERSFMKLEPEGLIITGIKAAEEGDAWIVRFFNPSGKSIKGSLTLERPVGRCDLVTLEEKTVESCAIHNNKIVFEISSKQIMTLKIFRKGNSE